MTPARMHPSSAWRPNLDRCRWVLTEQLEGEGAEWSEYAAAALVARGVTGMTLEQWARELRVPSEVVGSAEAGELSPERWPAALSLEVMPFDDRSSVIAACALPEEEGDAR
jgi:hypothetical protein